MKNKLMLVAAFALMFQACNSSGGNQTVLDQADETIAQSSNVPKASKIQLAKIKEYNEKNALCGKDDMQQVNSYDGKLGQTQEFVKKFQSSVAAMEEKGEDSSSKYCSGTMISEDLYLTANHCIDGSVGQYLAFNYEKEKNSTKLLKQEHFKITKIVEAGTGLDFAVLQIEGKPGTKYGFKKVKNELPAKDALLTIIQHPSGNPKTVEVGHRGGFNAPYMGYGDLDTEPGSSGSGVIDKDGNVVGVHTNGGCNATSGENKGVAMSEIFKVSKVLPALAAKQYIDSIELPPVPKKK